MSDLFSDRIEILADRAGGVKEFARKCGVSESVVRKWAKGQSDPSRAYLVAIAQGNGVLLDWIATGKGEMLPQTVGAPLPAVLPEHLPEPPEEWGEQFALVPRYDVLASAGGGCLNNENERIEAWVAFRRDWLRQAGLRVADLVTVHAHGDSMSPTIHDGALLLIDRSKRTIHGGIFVLRRAEALLVKRLQILASSALVILSDNPAYQSETLLPADLPQVEIIGRVELISHKPY